VKVFISWSGPRSLMVAEVLRTWLRRVIQASEPWISIDTDKGARWSEEISKQLEESQVGIFCLTRDNLRSPWLLFEAGAIAKNRTARPCTLLLDLQPKDVEQPLGMFQHTVPTREDVLRLVTTINNQVEIAGERKLDQPDLDAVFSTAWPELETKLSEVAKVAAGAPALERKPEDLLAEILYFVRGTAAQLAMLLRPPPPRPPEIDAAMAALGDLLKRGEIRNLGEMRDVREQGPGGSASP
jgi:TIR domain